MSRSWAWESGSPLRLLVPVRPDEVGGQDYDPEAFLIPQQHHLPAQTRLGFHVEIIRDGEDADKGRGGEPSTYV